jgi:hypothetical protein
LIVLFGVLMAFMMTFVFISVHDQQLNARVDEEANSLVERLAQTAFQSISGAELVTVALPSNVGGSSYTLQVLDNSTFVIEITAGRRVGNIFTSVVNADINVENSNFSPGGSVYFLQVGGEIVVSSSEIQASGENVLATPTTEPPEFYYFAKENAREATGIAAVYFDYGTASLDADVTAYEWDGDDLLVQVSENDTPAAAFRVTLDENLAEVGYVQSALVVSQIENIENLSTGTSTPSVENAYSGGWLYSSDAVLNHLRSRTWRRTADDLVISVPADANISAAAATTNVTTYPTWRITFENQAMFYRAMPWWENENTAGFIFQSDPELQPLV